jgi:DNA polymerase I
MSGRPTLALLDGYSLAYRAFFALPPDLRTTTGQPTNAAYGFTSMLVKLLEDQRPEGIAAVFDRGRPAERTQLLPSYKANRVESPDEFRSQLPLIDEVLRALAIPRVDLEGQEADDLIASYAAAASAEGWDVLVVTGDRDLFQLVDDGGAEDTTGPEAPPPGGSGGRAPRGNVRVLYTRRGISDTVVMDEAAVRDKYGIPPATYPSLAALRGDPSDNIPGVPGIGDKTASTLLAQWGSLDALYDHLGELRGKKVPAMLAAHRDAVFASRTVTTVSRDLPLPRPIEDLRMGDLDADAVRRLFATLEFRSLWDRLQQTLLGEQAEQQATGFDAAPRRAGAGDLARWVQGVPTGQPVAVLPTTAGALPDVQPVAIALAAAGADPVAAAATDLDDADRAALRALLSGDRGNPLWVHDGKRLHHFARGAGLGGVAEPAIDTELWAYILSPQDRSYDLERLALEHLNKRLAVEGEDVAADGAAASGGPAQLGLLLGGGDDADDGAWRARALRAQALFELAEVLDGQVVQRGQADLLRRIEVPLIAGLADLERAGITVDGDVLADLGEQLVERVEAARDAASQALLEDERDLDAHLDLKFLDSPKQLQSLLFDALGLKKTKRIKTGWSTDAAELAKITGEHPVVAPILAYREYSKLKGTYIDPLLALVGGRRRTRVHAELNQTVAVTGRLSSQNPNLQNIPIRTELGRQIRRAFVPGDGFDALLVADYSQIELRVMAHLSGDEGLLAAFRSGEDIHATTASMVFGIPIDQVSNAQRSKIKGMTYGLAYGLSSFGLAQQLSIDTAEAQQLMDAYFERFPGVRDYLYGGVEEARRTGYTETLTGRRRYLPDLMSDNRQRRQMAERMALNAPIQGTAADIMKIAMIDVRAAMADRGLRSQLLLQVHDELVCETVAAEHDELRQVLVDRMAGVIELAVPLEVDTATGPSWAEAEKH